MSGHDVSRRRFLGLSAASLAGIAFLGACAPADTGLGQNGSATPTGRPASERHVTLAIIPASARLAKGPDGAYHDAFIPSSIAVRVGQVIYLNIVNYSPDSHSFDVPDLRLNLDIAPATTDPAGSTKPDTTTAMFAVAQPGVYHWSCRKLCDGDASNWAMSDGTGQVVGQDGFMAGTITAT